MFLPSFVLLSFLFSDSAYGLYLPINSVLFGHIMGEPSSNLFFGTGYSAGNLSAVETDLFVHAITPGHVGVMDHFWATAGPGVLDNAMIRYYVDDEANASIAFIPPMACGTAIDGGKDTSPWGTKWFGKGAKDGAWFNNFRIPFYSSIRVTTQYLKEGHVGGFYIIVRGALDLAINFGGVDVPTAKKAKLVLQSFQKVVQPLEYVTTADVRSGHAGLLMMSTLAVESGNKNFLEGCYHAYTPYNASYPGVVLSTGTEDYFDSAWYFNAGQFRFPVSGFTHLNQNQTSVSWSAYRFHEMDPLRFGIEGFRLVWRNGDAVDPSTGLKCFTENGGKVVGHPTASNVMSYAWVYQWEEP